MDGVDLLPLPSIPVPVRPLSVQETIATTCGTRGGYVNPKGRSSLHKSVELLLGLRCKKITLLFGHRDTLQVSLTTGSKDRRVLRRADLQNPRSRLLVHPQRNGVQLLAILLVFQPPNPIYLCGKGDRLPTTNRAQRSSNPPPSAGDRSTSPSRTCRNTVTPACDIGTKPASAHK